MNPDKLYNVIRLSNQERYDYSIREFYKLEKVWAASTPDFWVTFVDDAGDEIFAIWPHKEAAELCLFAEIKDISNVSIEAIEYENFKKFCIPDMQNDGIYFGVFYDANRTGIVVDGPRLLEDMESEEFGEF